MSNAKRRTPAQQRSALRMESVLLSASTLIREMGYESVTMTSISERAGTSIGSLYQYFPDKEAVAQALINQYRRDLEDRWSPLMDVVPGLSPTQTANRLVDLIADFMDTHPAYLALHDAPLNFKRNKAKHDRLRHRIAGAFRVQQPKLGKEEARRIANVAIHILKGVGALYGRGAKEERINFVKEIKLALGAYLNARLKLVK